jgi:hypothetical protein
MLTFYESFPTPFSIFPYFFTGARMLRVANNELEVTILWYRKKSIVRNRVSRKDMFMKNKHLEKKWSHSALNPDIAILVPAAQTAASAQSNYL